MADETQPLPRTFWIIGGLALVWNLVGLMAFVMQITMAPEALQALPEPERAFYEAIPVWATSAFAIAVTAGVIGSILLLMRNPWCVPALLVSLAGALIQNYYAFAIGRAMFILGPSSAVLPTLVIAIGVGLIWYARYAKEKGWFK